MEAVEKKSNAEFVDYLRKVLSEDRKNSQIDLYPLLKRAYSIIKKNPAINIDLNNYREIVKGKRVSICYDGHYYFLLPIINGKPFAPSLTKEELLDIFKDLESNV